MDFFAEQFIPSREFNVSLIGPMGSPQVLPIAEIAYTSFWDNRPKYLGYAAKWIEDSVEYRESLPIFSELETKLKEQITAISLKCWKLFGLNGYARVDIRSDEAGDLYVLEVNADPGIAPGAGFVLAGEKAGISYAEIITKIVSVPCVVVRNS
jgi:D-alanine-D-alanine ligase